MGQTCTAEQYYASKRGTHVLRSSIEKGNRVVRCPKAVNEARRQMRPGGRVCAPETSKQPII